MIVGRVQQPTVHGPKARWPQAELPSRLGKSGQLAGIGRSVWLAVAVVPWHNFNLVGFGPVNLQARHAQDLVRPPVDWRLTCRGLPIEGAR